MKITEITQLESSAAELGTLSKDFVLNSDQIFDVLTKMRQNLGCSISDALSFFQEFINSLIGTKEIPKELASNVQNIFEETVLKSSQDALETLFSERELQIAKKEPNLTKDGLDKKKESLSKIDNISLCFLKAGIKILDGIADFKDKIDEVSPGLSDMIVRHGAGLIVGVLATAFPPIASALVSLDIPKHLSSALETEKLRSTSDVLKTKLENIENKVASPEESKEELKKKAIESGKEAEVFPEKKPSIISFFQKIIDLDQIIPKTVEEVKEKSNEVISNLTKIVHLNLTEAQNKELGQIIAKSMETLISPEKQDLPIFQKAQAMWESTKDATQKITKFCKENDIKVSSDQIKDALSSQLTKNLSEIQKHSKDPKVLEAAKALGYGAVAKQIASSATSQEQSKSR